MKMIEKTNSWYKDGGKEKCMCIDKDFSTCRLWSGLI